MGGSRHAAAWGSSQESLAHSTHCGMCFIAERRAHSVGSPSAGAADRRRGFRGPDPGALGAPPVDPTVLALLDELWSAGDANDARQTERPLRMLNITPDTGRFLWILVRAARATRILEVGTSNGYSTIWLADAARAAGGRVVTLERDPNKVRLARENLQRAGVAGWVDVREGPAAETLCRASRTLRPCLPRRRPGELPDLPGAGRPEARGWRPPRGRQRGLPPLGARGLPHPGEGTPRAPQRHGARRQGRGGRRQARLQGDIPRRDRQAPAGAARSSQTSRIRLPERPSSPGVRSSPGARKSGRPARATSRLAPTRGRPP